MLLAKLSHHWICADSNNWFKSYLSNCNQYVSVIEYESGIAAENCEIHQRTVLGLLFLLYINGIRAGFQHADFST